MDNGASSYRRFRDNGDQNALVEIIRDYKDGLILYLTSIVGNVQTAEELAEDKVADYEAYHHETAEIDFSNFKTGDSGSIVFYFQWEYDEENPYNPSSNISGMSMIIGYYVGEKGVVIGAGAEDAQLRYQSMFG